MSRLILTTDPHLNLRPDDAYRWAFFEYLEKYIKKSSFKPHALYILGDLTHDKDRHSAKLVNKIVRMLTGIAKHIPIKILMGNHDYTDPEEPFMYFLNRIPNIQFIRDPIRKGKIFMLPHSRQPEEDWSAYIPFPKGSVVYMHQTIKGAVASNGMPMEGIGSKMFSKCKRVWSGDIHVPQVLGKINYIGTPYPVYFGDYFQPRFIEYATKSDRAKSILYKGAPKKISYKVTDVEHIDFTEIGKGDLVRIEVSLPRTDFPMWKDIRESLKKKIADSGGINKGIDVKEVKRIILLEKEAADNVLGKISHLTDQQTVDTYCSREKVLGPLAEYGKKFL